MIRIVLLLFSVIITYSCTNVKKYNAGLEKRLAPEKLQADVDFANKKLQKLHPNLYWYIEKPMLDYKFDSLKQSINKPLTPPEFFSKLAPVIASVREGHLRLVPPTKLLTKKEAKKLEQQKGIFSRMNYVVSGDRLYIKDNAEKYEDLKVGTEILKIHDIPTKDLLNNYRTYFSGDGFNTTFKEAYLAKIWASYFTVQQGILDSIKVEIKAGNTITEKYLHREYIPKEVKKEQKKVIASIKKNESTKTKDYNPISKSFNRDLQFLGGDSTIAYMKIKTFSGKLSSDFYRKSFKELQKRKSSTLILDVRDNLGGSLSEIHNLYSYLTTEEFKFIEDIEITKPTSIFHADYLNNFPEILKPIGVIGYPIYAVGMGLSVKKHNGKTYLRNNTIFTLKKPKKEAFQGKIYLLINSTSFSASAILASKLKNDKRAVLVGEETGGANDGTVAGRYATIKLPNSKLYLPIGLMLIKPSISFSNKKRGVFPDVLISPTTSDILSKKDLSLDYIFKELGISNSK